MRFNKLRQAGTLIVALTLLLSVCAGCSPDNTGDETDGEIIETLDTHDHDHQHQWDLIEVVEPWFERRGFTRYLCNICGTELDTDFEEGLVAEAIHCVFYQEDMRVTPNTDINSLRSNLYVFATCTNGLEVELDGYMLDGALEAQTSVITVYFMDCTTTFNVKVDME